MKSMLYNAIIGWYDSAISNYKGLEDPVFIDKVCTLTGMDEEHYRSLMFENGGDNEYVILSNNSSCDDLSIHRVNGTRDDAYKKMQALVLAKAANVDMDAYMEVYTDPSEGTASITFNDYHEEFRILKTSEIIDVDEVDGVAQSNLDAIPNEINWDNETAHYALHDVGRE